VPIFANNAGVIAVIVPKARCMSLTPGTALAAVAQKLQFHRGWSLAISLQEGNAMPQKDHGSSIKDDERYEALRREGMSKEKAARIANTDRKEAGRRGGKSEKYENWSKEDLYDKAKEVGIEGRSQMSKKELIQSLRNH
jgi:hypothetical protein